MHETVEEIRINPRYTQHVKTQFQDGKLSEAGIPIIRTSVSSTDAYLKKITSGMDTNQTILPPNCRYIEKLTNGTLVVIEEPPAYRTITVNYSMGKELEILEADNKISEYGIDKDYYLDTKNMPWKFNLAMPYVIHVLMFDKYDALMTGSVYLRNARLASKNDYLLKMPMMNISSDGFICYGDKAGGKRGSLTASIENTIMVFWSATFNSDYTYNYTAYRKVAGVSTYIGWQAMSQIDPMFIYNVEWLRMEENMGEAIQRMKDHCDGRPKNSIDYGQLRRIFTQPTDTGVEEKVRRTGRGNRTSRLFYDITQGLYIDDNFFLHVGDPIKWGKGIAHIVSFIGFFETDNIRIVRLQLQNGKQIDVRYNRKMKEYIKNGAKEIRFAQSGLLKNGVEIKPEDILIMSTEQGGKVYRKVHFIRNARDGITEAKLGNAFYILENTEGELFNIETPTYQGMEVNKDSEYIAISSPAGVPLHAGYKAKFDGIDVTRIGELKMQFRVTEGRSRGYKHTINMSNARSTSSQRLLFNSEQIVEAPPIFSNGRNLLCVRGDKGEIITGKSWFTPEGIVHDQNYEMHRPYIREVAEHLLSEDGSTFRVRSFNNDIEFKIGDKVVYSDWENPVNMLITRTITAFMIDEDEQTMTIVVEDKDGKLSKIPYITQTRKGSSSNRAGNIAIGRMRKISNKFGRITAGTKIKATKGYIPHFPKKDVNIIIGFITDTGGEDPLVLCSNCCTLWYSDVMEHFKIISIKSKKWAALQHAPIDITKIKVQPGDIVNGITDYKTHAGWLVHQQIDGSRIKISSLNNFTSYPDNYTFDNYTRSQMRLDCIPNPRISPTEQGKMNYKRGLPNFHGLFMESIMTNFQFLDDGRSLLHVSDPH